MKINFISPRVLFLETDKSQMISKNKKQITTGTSSTGKSASSGGSNGNSGIVNNFILQEDKTYLLQEDGSRLYL